jgi:hypothetical protein
VPENCCRSMSVVSIRSGFHTSGLLINRSILSTHLTNKIFNNIIIAKTKTRFISPKELKGQSHEKFGELWAWGVSLGLN